jgi:methylthioribose-1-phosphate isomerase
MQHGMVDMVMVGSDRTTCTGDVANKIGTYLKALASKDNNITIYAVLPSSSIDWKMQDGLKEIVIEERDGDEVKYIEGMSDGQITKVLLTPQNSKAANYAFDVTPARLVTGIITERGFCEANKESILDLFPEKK